MSLGPVEYLIVEFPENRFDGTIVPALNDLVDQGLIRILDLVFITKDADGTVGVFEFEDVPGDASVLADLRGEAGVLLSDEDIQQAAEELDPNSSAGLLVWEDVWAVPFVEALRRCGAQLVDGGRVRPEVVDAALAAAEG